MRLRLPKNNASAIRMCDAFLDTALCDVLSLPHTRTHTAVCGPGFAVFQTQWIWIVAFDNGQKKGPHSVSAASASKSGFDWLSKKFAPYLKTETEGPSSEFRGYLMPKLWMSCYTVFPRNQNVDNDDIRVITRPH